MKLLFFKNSDLLFSSFYYIFFLWAKLTLHLNNLKTRTAMNAKIFVFVICFEVYFQFRQWIEMYLCEMTGAKYHIHKYMVLQCSKIIYYKDSGEFLRQDSQCSCSFGKIQNVGERELSVEKVWCFIGERFHISFSYIFFC